MRHHPLGRTGLFVSELCLGTMTFGGVGALWGQIGQLTSRILNRTLPATTVCETLSWTWIEPHFLQMTVVPTTVFVTALARTAAMASSGGSASATTHAAIVRTRLATSEKGSGSPGG